MARKMVCEWGMSDKIGPQTVGEHEEEVFLGREWGHTNAVSDDMARLVDSEIKALIDEARERCRTLLTEHIDALHAIAHALLERETITGDDIDVLMRGDSLPPFQIGAKDGDQFHVEEENQEESHPSTDATKPESAQKSKEDSSSATSEPSMTEDGPKDKN